MARFTSGQDLAVVARFSINELSEIELQITILAVHMPGLLLRSVLQREEALSLRHLLFSFPRPAGAHDEASWMIFRR
jgi:hypothetical protein